MNYSLQVLRTPPKKITSVTITMKEKTTVGNQYLKKSPLDMNFY